MWFRQKVPCQSLGYFVLFFFRAAPAAYRGSQARGPIGAVVPAYATASATPDLSRACDLDHSSWLRRILNPLNEAWY